MIQQCAAGLVSIVREDDRLAFRAPPLIRSGPLSEDERAEAVRVAELERFMARMTHLAPEDQRRIEQLTRSIVNRMLHAPTVRLREAAERRAAEHE